MSNEGVSWPIGTVDEFEQPGTHAATTELGVLGCFECRWPINVTLLRSFERSWIAALPSRPRRPLQRPIGLLYRVLPRGKQSGLTG